MRMRSHPAYSAVTLILTFMLANAIAYAHRDSQPDPPRIQIALLLDTSNSMDGLIAQAKTRLWRIVNEFATAEQHGIQPVLEVALFEYGNSRLPREDGYVRQVLGLSRDLDTLSQRLFSLTTCGGEEYCGHVIREALTQLKWSNRQSDLKLIVIAGNEPFTQGSVHYEDACRLAKRSDVVVNTIHCGDHETGIAGKWREGALLAGGSYMSINHEKAVMDVRCPQDDEIVRLNKELNETYVYYGKQGASCWKQQTDMDNNAQSEGNDVIVSRSRTKCTSFYNNGHWDLVDATQKSGFRIEDVPESELSSELRKMTVTERKEYVRSQYEKRQSIQWRIRELHSAREKHITEIRKQKGESTADGTLDEAMIRILREQAINRNYTFEE